jgi:hydrogenase maturation protease
MKASGDSASLLVLGLGNFLCSDDGLGVAAVDLLVGRYRLPESVRVIDGGTLGLSLLSYIRSCDDVILVDAISDEGPPGTFIRLEGTDVAPAVRNRLSCHQIGVADLLNALDLLDEEPRSLTLLGLIPKTLELGLGLSPPVENQLPVLVEKIADEACRLGHQLLPHAGMLSTEHQHPSRGSRPCRTRSGP